MEKDYKVEIEPKTENDRFTEMPYSGYECMCCVCKGGIIIEEWQREKKDGE